MLGTRTAFTPSSSPAQQAAQTPNEKDFCEILNEIRNPDGTVIVIVADSEGQPKWGEFQEALGVKKVLVVREDKFKPFTPTKEPEKKPAPKTGK